VRQNLLYPGALLSNNSGVKRISYLWPVLMLLAAPGCTLIQPFILGGDGGRGAATVSHSADAFVPTRERVVADAEMLGNFSQELRELATELEALQRHVSGKTAGALTEADHDLAEGLLYRYLLCREALVETAADYSGSNVVATVSVSTRIKGSLLGLLARQLIYSYDALLADLFFGESWVIGKFNATYPGIDVPARTYDRLSEAAMSTTRREVREAAWRLFYEELRNPYSALSRQDESDPECNVLVRAIRAMHATGAERTRSVLTKRVAREPSFQTRTNPGRVYALVQKARAVAPTNLDAAVALDSRGVLPLVIGAAFPSLVVTPAQQERIEALVKPGDVILTLTRGSLFNMFLREPFIHAITYVGPEGGNPETKKRNPDLVEAVSAGVIRSSLNRVIGERSIGRLAVLRPRLDADARQLVRDQLFTYTGRKYDLRFDFSSDRRLCCTEVVYHTLDGRGAIEFNPVKRMGLKTVSAGDILKVALAPDRDAFDVICVLDKKRGRGVKQTAMLLTGNAAVDHLRGLTD
jgi:hypothetical protein